LLAAIAKNPMSNKISRRNRIQRAIKRTLGYCRLGLRALQLEKVK